MNIPFTTNIWITVKLGNTCLVNDYRFQEADLVLDKCKLMIYVSVLISTSFDLNDKCDTSSSEIEIPFGNLLSDWFL